MKKDPENIIKLRSSLLTWFKTNRRALPWRENPGWYKTWISEIMLQQTQVQQVLPYFLRFMKVFPDVKKLARARQQTVLRLWEGLGYYTRARNLHRTAKTIVTRFEGELPRDYKLLSGLPGFGPYTTHAVLSIAFNQSFAVVDGNVMRVASRLFRIREDLRLPGTLKKIQTFMEQMIDPESPGLFNEAIMELGARVCLPKNPFCTCCPLANLCAAFLSDHVSKYPRKSKPIPRSTIRKVTLVLQNRNKFLIAKRFPQGLLGGYWEFPGYQIPPHRKQSDRYGKFLLIKHGIKNGPIRKLPDILHTYTHFNLRMIPYHVQTTQKKIRFDGYEECKWILWPALKKLPIHRAMRKLIATSETGLIPVSKR